MLLILLFCFGWLRGCRGRLIMLRLSLIPAYDRDVKSSHKETRCLAKPVSALMVVHVDGG